MLKLKTILIPLAKSKIDYLDLKYFLRSVEKYVTGYSNIVIVGECPKAIKNVDFLPFSETFNEMHKERNILDKLTYACKSDLVSEDFVAVNDDYFFLKETDISDYPFYHKGEIATSNNSKGMYRHTLRHTLEYLESKFKETLNYDTHCPIIYNKQKFLATFEPIDFNIPFGYGIKSMYANLNDIEGVYMSDCKISGRLTRSEVEQKCEGRHIISCNEAALRHGLGEYLKDKFPNKSKFE